jgi:hypothetical protein
MDDYIVNLYISTYIVVFFFFFFEFVIITNKCQGYRITNETIYDQM